MVHSDSCPDSQVFDAKDFVRRAPTTPGVYRMLDAKGDILYVGKAKNLRSRLKSYFANTGLAPKTRALVARIAGIQVTLTQSETEALILEQTQIKELKPPYNILLRDDKSYPYIYLATDKDFPSVKLKRVRTKGKVGQYFGPYPSAGSVKESLSLLEKLFKVRQCEESFYSNRSRPCLQYQIKRCKAPCVGLVERDEYQQDLADVVLFLQGKSPELIRLLIERMEQASTQLEFERAAEYRDQITHLRHVQEAQSAESGSSDLDVLALVQGAGVVVFSVLYVRQGRLLGHKNHIQKEALERAPDELLQAFLAQYYLFGHGERDIPPEVLTSVPLSNDDEDMRVLVDAIAQTQGRAVRINSRSKGVRLQWLDLAHKNASNALAAWLQDRQTVQNRLAGLGELLSLARPPTRIECFDISHSSGERTVASCVVFNEQGPLKSDYRSYNIEDITAGDDYAAMRQVLTRRYGKLKGESEKLPDLILIDGGKGQLNLAIDILNRLNLRTENLVGVAKGVSRKPGFETLWMPLPSVGEIGTEPALRVINCQADHPGLHLIQQIRDEAHRFAITGHRNRRDKARKQSALEQIEGVGPKRRKELLSYFGSVQNIKRVSVEEIAKVKGMSRALAEQVYLSLHDQ